MKNFIFKSDSDFHKMVFNKLETVQKELRHQRLDNSEILRLLQKILVDSGLQKQVDEYFEDDEPETSPQTESDNKQDLD